MTEDLENILDESIENLDRPGDDIKVSRNMDLLLEDIASLYDAMCLIDKSKRQLKMMENLIKAKGKVLMKENNIKSFTGENGINMILSVEKKDVFDNETIYDFYNANEGIRRALPKNPAWKKSVLKIDIEDGFEEICKTIEKTDIKLGKPKEEVKLLDTNFIR